MRNERIPLPIRAARPYGRRAVPAAFEDALSARAVIRDVFEQTDRGYLEVLDENSTFFDYDAEVDETLIDLDFCTSRFSHRRTARRRPA